MNTLNLLSARGWFGGLLAIMIIVTVLFALIIVIAVKPIRKEGLYGEQTQKMLKQREAELTSEILHHEDDKEKEELIGKLRDVQSAEKIVDALLDGKSAHAKTEQKPLDGDKPAKRANPKKQTAERQADKTADEQNNQTANEQNNQTENNENK